MVGTGTTASSVGGGAVGSATDVFGGRLVAATEFATRVAIATRVGEIFFCAAGCAKGLKKVRTSARIATATNANKPNFTRRAEIIAWIITFHARSSKQKRAAYQSTSPKFLFNKACDVRYGSLVNAWTVTWVIAESPLAGTRQVTDHTPGSSDA